MNATQQNTNAPIGLFDSGIGGLSIWRELVRLLPYESTVYVADSANCPYGFRSKTEIRAISARIITFLLNKGCKLIVVACNTASAAALYWLREQFNVPFVGLEPALKPAAQASQTGHIGILATQGTLHGELLKNTIRTHAQLVQVHVRVGTGLVEQIETGQLDTPMTKKLLFEHLEVLLAEYVDQIALGCTHYPLLQPLIDQILAGRAKAIDPAPAVIRQVKRLLTAHELQTSMKTSAQKTPVHQFYSTGAPEQLQRMVNRFSASPITVQSLSLSAINVSRDM
ncbi:glutamate racemase [Anaerolineales bacterium HSG24]|nr:glutamate racemase [Anaerolineales bacterium HSG24]